MHLARQLAIFATQADAASLPALDRDILRRHSYDVAIARLLGGATQEGRHLRKVFRPGTGADDIAGIAGLVRMTEMDDIHVGANTTPSSVAVPVAFSLFPESAGDPRTLESAIYVGADLIVRFGKAMDGAKALFQGFWPTRTGATLAACATACRMLGLSLDQTEQAISFAMMTTAGRSGRFLKEPSGRWIVFANAVSTGLRMAYAAREGFNSVETPPDAAWLSASLGLEISEEAFTADLGQTSIFPELALKPYGSARQSLGATEAMRHLVAEGLDPQTIGKVIVRVPTSHKGMVSLRLDSKARGSAFVSAACQVATAALCANDLYDVERRNVLTNSRIVDLAARIEIVGDPALDVEFPKVWAASVEVEAAGRTLRHEIREPIGSPGNRMGDADLLAKSRIALGYFGQEQRAEEVQILTRDMFTNAASATALAALFTAG